MCQLRKRWHSSLHAKINDGGATAVKFIIGPRLSNIIRRPKQQSARHLQPYISVRQSDLRSELYYVHSIKEYVPGFVVSKGPETQEVTIVEISFTTGDIWIALPGGGIAFEEVS